MGVFKRPGSNNWQIRYSYNGKVYVKSAKTTQKRIAQKQLDIIKAEIARGKHKVVQKQERITLKDYSEQFLEWIRVHRKQTSYKRYRVSLNKILVFFGNSKLCDINTKNIEKYRDVRRKNVSNSTINRDLACLKSLFNHAIKDGFCDHNPIKRIKFQKEPKRALYYLDEDEAQSLIESCDTEAIKTFVILGLNTGMRTQEMLSLKWTEINFKDNIITLKDTKSGNEETVLMNKNVLNHFSGLDKTRDYVISKPNGENYIDVRRAWDRVIKKAGIKKCSPHILRHTFATTLTRLGADLLVVKELGRWSDLKLVERYAHIGREHRTRIVSLLDGKFGGDTKGDTVDEN